MSNKSSWTKWSNDPDYDFAVSKVKTDGSNEKLIASKSETNPDREHFHIVNEGQSNERISHRYSGERSGHVGVPISRAEMEKELKDIADGKSVQRRVL